MKNKILVFLLVICATSLSAQYGSYFGFKGGASINGFQNTGLLPQESTDIDFGLHFGGIYGFRFSDYIGIETGLQYSQKGGLINYEGDSYAVLRGETRDILIEGQREMERRIEFHSLTVPAQFTVRPVDWFQVGVGAYAGIGVAATMEGSYTITDAITQNQTEVPEYSMSLGGTYYTDKRGPDPLFSNQEFNTFTVEGELIVHPFSDNPYREHSQDTEKYIKRFDGGLYGSIEFSLRKGFSIGSSFSYQLSPITNPGGELKYNEIDEDQNFSTAEESKKLWNAVLYLALTI